MCVPCLIYMLGLCDFYVQSGQQKQRQAFPCCLVLCWDFFLQQMLVDLPTDFVVSTMSVSSSSGERNSMSWPLKTPQSSPVKSKTSPCLWTRTMQDSVEHFQQVWSVSEPTVLLCCLQRQSLESHGISLFLQENPIQKRKKSKKEKRVCALFYFLVLQS